MKISVCIGHGKSQSGQYDSGAVASGYQEFKLARAIGKYLKQELSKYNCTVDLINYDGDKNLAERIKYVNSKGYDLNMELHLNAGGGTGPEVYYKHNSKQGKALATAISKSIATNLGLKDRGAKTKLVSGQDYFGCVREIKCMSFLVETVFIDTKGDRDKVIYASGQEQCAKAIAAAVAKYYGLGRKETPKPAPEPSPKPAPTPSHKKSNTEIAKEVIQGKWGNGAERKKRLKDAGYDYAAVQKEVERLLAGQKKPAKKSVDEVAREVIAGKWGNGVKRVYNLTKAGYNYAAVQKRVNEILKGK